MQKIQQPSALSEGLATLTTGETEVYYKGKLYKAATTFWRDDLTGDEYQTPEQGDETLRQIYKQAEVDMDKLTVTTKDEEDTL